jgi:preprotein translocase subunit SecA
VASFKEILPVLRRIPFQPPPLTERTQSGSPNPAGRENRLAPDCAERTQSTPRNAPCPCGSGQKYKRCCGRNAPAVLNVA